MSTNSDSVSFRSFTERIINTSERYLNHSGSNNNNNNNNNNVTFYESTSNKSTSGMSSGPKLATIVTATSSSSNTNNVITSVLGGAGSLSGSVQSSSGKKHSFGYQLRRWFRNTTGTGSRHRSSQRDIEAGNSAAEQNFIRHTASIYSTSSGESEHHTRIFGSKRKSSNRHHRSAQSASTGVTAAEEATNVIQNEFANFFAGSKKKSRDNQAAAGAGDHPEASSSSSQSAAVINLAGRETYECPICLLEQPVGNYPELISCHHRVCLNCMKQYLRIEICESRILLTCTQCVELLHPNDIQTILLSEPKLLEKYETFMIRRYLITEPDARWCPAPDCNYCVIATGCASCPKLQCGRKSCETLFCYHCKQHWHAHQTCDEARQTRYRMYNGASGSSKSLAFAGGSSRYSSSRDHRNYGGRSSNASTPDGPFSAEDMKPCPCCKVLIVKMDDGSCNHMTCSVCGTEFCWLCMQKISDLHYLSPSGCTFWGKKPWSRKKKIMWQLGMLVGAPVGIALIAGIAVPAIIIGIPVWVGRKLHARFERNLMPRPRSNLLVTAGVVTSVFVSPILAAVAVGIGVPILLAYVYGVVPISLCRSGGCGVSTSSSGVKFEMDDDEISTNGQHADGFSIDTALSGHGRRIANPSIGEMSLGLSTSLSIGSNSHLDRLTAGGGCDTQIDRESSSIQACAGSIASAGTLQILPNYSATGVQQSNNSTTGSIGSGVAGPISGIVCSPAQSCQTSAGQSSGAAGVRCPEKRSSLCSTNADTLSFGDQRSINTNLSSVDGDASLKVLNGSIRDHYSTVSPIEVHVDIVERTEHTDNDNDDEQRIYGKWAISKDLPSDESTSKTAAKLDKTNSKKSFTSAMDSNHHYLNGIIPGENDDDDDDDVEDAENDEDDESCNGTASGKHSHLGKYESRSLEYLSNNFCRLCHRSHRPCCPNFQHRLKRNLNSSNSGTKNRQSIDTPAKNRDVNENNSNNKNNIGEDSKHDNDHNNNQNEDDSSDDNKRQNDDDDNDNNNVDKKNTKNDDHSSECDKTSIDIACDELCYHRTSEKQLLSPSASEHYPYSVKNDLREARKRHFTGSFDSAFIGLSGTSNKNHHPTLPWSSNSFVIESPATVPAVGDSHSVNIATDGIVNETNNDL